MKELPKKYKHREEEKHWQDYWLENKTYRWEQDLPRDETFVIDTPPPTVSGVLHMGHVFSYVQADIVARYQRMAGKTVFYPMGFDDNGLPTERLVEKAIGKKAVDMSREEFIAECEKVVEEAEHEFEHLFNSVALSVDWEQKYETISERSRAISQLSFLDLYNKGHVYRQPEPVLWDPSDRTALAQADVVDKEQKGMMNDILFGIDGSDEKITIATTRPELLAACVAVFYHPEDERYKHLEGKTAITPLFNVKVPIIADDKVEMEKGSGLVMCCTFGDQTDVYWWKTHNLDLRIILGKDGRICGHHSPLEGESKRTSESEVRLGGGSAISEETVDPSPKNDAHFSTLPQGEGDIFSSLIGLTVKQAKEKSIELLKEAGLLVNQTEVTQQVKCAERSGCPLEILVTPQWFVRILDKKEELIKKVEECDWNPDYMKIRAEQWIEGLSWDWCISRQRYFGVPFPVWYLSELENYNKGASSIKIGEKSYRIAHPEDLPVNPLVDLPRGYKLLEKEEAGMFSELVEKKEAFIAKEEATGKIFLIKPDKDVMDTWATSSVSPQLSSWGICDCDNHPPLEGGSENSSSLSASNFSGRGCPPPELAEHKCSQSPTPPQGEGNNPIGSDNPLIDYNRHKKLFPADLRPQAHEIIRTWAFYTIVKAYLHENTIPWKALMISGWCLAPDKTKMSKSKGNVITPVDLIEEKGADVVRYWASTSRLGADTAYSEDVLKVGKKLVNKLWNATKFASLQIQDLLPPPSGGRAGVGLTENADPSPKNPTDFSTLPSAYAKASSDRQGEGEVTETLDKWILTRLHKTVKKATKEFEKYEYCVARGIIEDFFWNDFCDNYLELAKTRAYGEGDIDKEASLSAKYTLYTCVNAILRLFAPFVPHITETLYSHIFEEDFNKLGSVHSRGNWCRAEDYPLDEKAEEAGILSVEILEEIRKAKSEKEVSIKYPVKNLTLPSDKKDMLEPVLGDLINAGSVENVEWGDETEIEISEESVGA